MAETPREAMTPATYDARLLRMSWDAVERSKKLLADTRPLVARIAGGSVIGARALYPDEGDPSGDVPQSLDG